MTWTNDVWLCFFFVQSVLLFVVSTLAAALADGMRGVDVAIVCTGFVPGNPFKMGAAAHAVVGGCTSVLFYYER
jgi:hypothetical protein